MFLFETVVQTMDPDLRPRWLSNDPTMRDANDQEHEYTARHCPALARMRSFSEYADLDPRADFLTQLWIFCAQEKINFPLTEKVNKDVTVS